MGPLVVLIQTQGNTTLNPIWEIEDTEQTQLCNENSANLQPSIDILEKGTSRKRVILPDVDSVHR